MGAAVERLAAHIGGWLAGDAQGHQHAAGPCSTPRGVVAVIGQPDRVVGRDMNAVRPGEDALAPGAQQIAVLVEYRDRVVAAIEGVYIFLRVGSDRGATAEPDLVRDLRPVLVALEIPPAAAEPLRHRAL